MSEHRRAEQAEASRGEDMLVGIPESQLRVWAKQGAVATAASTYNSVNKALLGVSTSPVRYKDVDVYLQGSYRNDTNIRGDSDIDVVVELNSTWSRNLSRLSDHEAELYKSTYPRATYLWADFRSDVLAALRSYFGRDNVSEGNKSLKIAGGTGHLPADVVVCQEHREYRRFYGVYDQQYVEGIKFWIRRERIEVINFPKVHYENGVNKNSFWKTGGAYKPTVRVFKNARTYLSTQGVISNNLAPSYFLECLLYNAPDGAFRGTHHEIFFNILKWVHGTDLSTLWCQNEQTLLFGPTPEQWNTTDARGLVAALIKLWNEWS